MADGTFPRPSSTTDAENQAGPKGGVDEVFAVPSLCGVTCDMPRSSLFLTLTAGSLCSALAFAALQEGIYRIPGFKFNGWLTLGTTVVYCACAALEMLLTRDFQRKGSLRWYLVLSALMFGGMYFTNWALNYLNYATRILFKSSKVVPTMALGHVMQGRRYQLSEYAAAAVLVVGIVFFTLGDAEFFPRFNMIGVGLISLGVVCDALTSNLEEKVFFRTAEPSSHAEVIFYSSLIGIAYGWVMLVWTGELGPAWQHSLAYPQVPVLIISSSVMGYLSVAVVLLLIGQFGATNTEIIKSLKKVLSVVVSFVVYPKPVGSKYVLGMAACVASLVMTHQLRLQKVKAGGSTF